VTDAPVLGFVPFEFTSDAYITALTAIQNWAVALPPPDTPSWVRPSFPPLFMQFAADVHAQNVGILQDWMPLVAPGTVPWLPPTFEEDTYRTFLQLFTDWASAVKLP
jgi:hypothetical protein